MNAIEGPLEGPVKDVSGHGGGFAAEISRAIASRRLQRRASREDDLTLVLWKGCRLVRGR